MAYMPLYYLLILWSHGTQFVRQKLPVSILPQWYRRDLRSYGAIWVAGTVVWQERDLSSVNLAAQLEYKYLFWRGCRGASTNQGLSFWYMKFLWFNQRISVQYSMFNQHPITQALSSWTSIYFLNLLEPQGCRRPSQPTCCASRQRRLPARAS